MIFLYLFIVFVFFWLITSFIFLLKKRRWLFYLTILGPLLAVVLIFLLMVLIVLLPLVYIGLFIFSIFVPSYEEYVFGKKIKVD